MINVAVLGFGTVGSGVAEVLTMNKELITQRVGTQVDLKYILVRRDFPGSPYQDKFVRDFSFIEDDPEVDVVAEVMGGTGAALDYTVRAIKAGKSVVTSNKELVAAHGYELLKLAQENGVSYLFEASVGGGIPILRPLSNCLAGNEISQVSGILNGTTNYILTRMIRAGLTFDQALAEAQELGYAEKDPTADVDGHDACRKICILAALAYGQHVYPEQVATQGIRSVALEDVSYAESKGYRIKLLGRALRQGEKVCAYVAPHLVPDSSPLAGVEDVFNAIALTGNAVGDVMFYGRGAGKLPTASAVVGDIIDIARDPKRKRHNMWGPGREDLVVSPENQAVRWYVRADAAPAGVELLSRADAPEDEKAFLTAAMDEAELNKLVAGLEVRSLFRVLD